jgi:hypothetical protein
MTVGVHFSGKNLSALAVRFRASHPSSPSPTSTGLDFGDGRQLQAGHRRPSERTARYFGQVVSLVHARFREFCAPYSRRDGSRIVSIDRIFNETVFKRHARMIEDQRLGFTW